MVSSLSSSSAESMPTPKVGESQPTSSELPLTQVKRGTRERRMLLCIYHLSSELQGGNYLTSLFIIIQTFMVLHRVRTQ